MSSKGCFGFRKLASQDYEIPLLNKEKRRKTKSRDDAYLTDVFVFIMYDIEYHGVQ